MLDVRPLLGRMRPLVFALIAGLGSVSAHAALFGDDEARRAILDLRQLRAQDREAHTALTAQVDQLKHSLLEMNAQITRLREELAQQRGQEELLQRDVAELQRRLKDAQAVQDQRLRQLEPQTVTADGKTFQVMPEEKRMYDEALASLRGADFAAGATGLTKLLQAFPQTGYRDSAWYWLGNAHYGQRAYKPAIQVFNNLATQSPDHVRAPEALLSMANCHLELKETANARKVLTQLISKYPKSEAAQTARDRLLTLPK